MIYKKRSARELYDEAVRKINNLKREMARLDGQLAAWDEIRAELYEQMMAEQQIEKNEEEEKPEPKADTRIYIDGEPYQPQDPTRDRLFQPKGPEETNGQQTH